MNDMSSADARSSAADRPGGVLAALAAILLVALAIRVCLLLTATMTSRDTATFVWYAQDLGTDPLTAMRGHDQHPLYPVMILAVRQTVGRLVTADGVREWVVSAQFAACGAGLAAVIGVYLLAARLFTRRSALVAALLMALLSEACQLSADGLSDMPHLMLYLFAATALIAGFRRGSPGWSAAAGALSGLAFLTRPEGAAVAVVGLAGVGMVRLKTPTRRRIACGLLCTATFFVVAGPYMLATGRMVRKKSLRQLFHLAGSKTLREDGSVRTGISGCPSPLNPRGGWPMTSAVGDANSEAQRVFPISQEAGHPCNGNPQTGVWRTTRVGQMGAAASVGRDVVSAVWEILEKYFRAGRVLFVLPMLVGLVVAQVPRAEADGRRLVQMLAGIHLVLLFALRTAYGYVAMRHVLLLVVLTLPFSAAALTALVDALASHLSVKAAQPLARARRHVWIALMVVLVGGTGYWTFRPLHAERGYIRRAGEWIRAAGFPPDTVIITTRHRVAFHAGCRATIPPDTGRIADLAGFIDRAAAWVAAGHDALLVVDEDHITSDKRNPRFFEELAASFVAPGRLKPVHVEPAIEAKNSRRIHIYRVTAPARS